MKTLFYKALIAGSEIIYQLRHEKTKDYLYPWLIPVPPAEHAVSVSSDDINEWKDKWGFPNDGYTEYGLLVYRTSDFLLKRKACVFHAASFLLNEKAFVFTAESGTGKTTQLNNWKDLFPNEIKIMNGDKPVLSIRDDTVMVFPSPWKGKERLGDDTLTATLGGIILLEQGNTNRISRLSPEDAVIPLMKRFLFTGEDKEMIHDMCYMLETILKKVPVWKLVNKGDLDSTNLAKETILREAFHEI
ncbi:MAG: hypothetical protein IKR03_00535 [Clostridia bacterium]|nr:hypothetical protein [Clostridia bacterium]